MTHFQALVWMSSLVCMLLSWVMLITFLPWHCHESCRVTVTLQYGTVLGHAANAFPGMVLDWFMMWVPCSAYCFAGIRLRISLQHDVQGCARLLYGLWVPLPAIILSSLGASAASSLILCWVMLWVHPSCYSAASWCEPPPTSFSSLLHWFLSLSLSIGKLLTIKVLKY